MWSGPEAAGGVATTQPHLRRGHVWLAELPPDRRQRAVLLLSRDPDAGVGMPLLVAPLGLGAAAAGRVAVEMATGFDGAMVDVRRLTAVDRAALIQPLARLAAPRLAEVDLALRDLLGLDGAAWPLREDVDESAETVEPLSTTASPQAHVVVAPAALDRLGDSPPPPPPPPVAETAPAVRVDDRDGGNFSAGLDDHPIAQLFGRPRPVLLQQAPAPPRQGPLASPGGATARATRAADVMPELLGIVQRRLHRSAPRLEAVLSQAAEEGRSVEWAAAAVRHASVRGVMQSTLDELATELAAVGVPGATS